MQPIPRQDLGKYTVFEKENIDFTRIFCGNPAAADDD
jgi:hypothetical protein